MMTKTVLLLASLLLLWVSILTTGLSVVYCLYHGVWLLLSTIITCLNVYIAVSYHQLSGSLRILSELIYDHVLEGGHVLKGEWSTELSYFGGVRTNLIDCFLRVHRNGIMELGANVEEDGEWLMATVPGHKMRMDINELHLCVCCNGSEVWIGDDMVQGCSGLLN